MSKLESWTDKADFEAMKAVFVGQKGWTLTTYKEYPNGHVHSVFTSPRQIMPAEIDWATGKVVSNGGIISVEPARERTEGA
jgi:hypothetical protein